MTTLTTKASIVDGRLKLDIPTSFPAGEVNVVVQIEASTAEEKQDIAAILALAGTLKWKGDAVKMQRALRDEWPD